MEQGVDSGAHASISMIGKNSVQHELMPPDSAQETTNAIFSVQVMEFKTSLLEAVEELHIQRDAETRYEAQISNLALEKQELEWQKESLQRKIDSMANEHSESLAALKKQFQAQVRSTEEEKGKQQMRSELKDKEIISLKEELKSLQLLKYSLEKKLSELEQKLQLHTQTKDSHLDQLAEAEKRFGTVSRHFAMIKQAHEKLKQNVEEAIRLNDKLTALGKKQKSTISSLKQDVEKLNTELVKSKVSSICRSGDENSYLIEKKQEIQQLQQLLHVEKEMNEKLRKEIMSVRTEKQEVIKSLQHIQQLLQTQTQTVSQCEQELHTQREEYQAFKREHELILERNKEKEDRFAHLMEEYQNFQKTAEKERKRLLERIQAEEEEEELRSVGEGYDHFHEKHNKRPASPLTLQAEKTHDKEGGLKDCGEDQGNDLTTDKYDDGTGILNSTLTESDPSDTQRDPVSPHVSFERMDQPEETASLLYKREEPDRADSQRKKSKEVNICVQKDPDSSLPLLPNSPALVQSGTALTTSILLIPVTNQLTDPVVKQRDSVGEGEPAYSLCDNASLSSVGQCDTADCNSGLSPSETRSVYGVDRDPGSLEKKDDEPERTPCIPEKREVQTSDKHHRDRQNCAAPEDSGFNSEENAEETALESFHTRTLQQTTSEINAERTQKSEGNYITKITRSYDDSSTRKSPQLTELLMNSPVKSERSDAAVSVSLHLSFHQPHGSPHDVAKSSVNSACDTQVKGSENQDSQLLGDLCLPLPRETQNHSKQGEALPETVGTLETASVAVDQSITATDVENLTFTPTDLEITLEEAILPPNTEVQTVERDSLTTEKPPSLVNTLEAEERQVPEIDVSCLAGSKRYRSSFELGSYSKEKRDSQLRGSQVDAVHSAVIQSDPNPEVSPVPPVSSVSEQKSEAPSGFHELIPPFPVPFFKKDKLMKKDTNEMAKTADKLSASNIHPHQMRDQQTEWNAIKQTFYEVSSEKVRVPVSFRSSVPSAASSYCVGNGLQQDCAPIISPPRLHSSGKVDRSTSEVHSPSTPDNEPHKQCDIRAQIAKIQQILSFEEARLPKRRKITECEEVKPEN